MTEGQVKIETDVVFGVGGNRDLKCDVFSPPGDGEDRAAVILIHGGGWRDGDRSQLRGYGILLGREGYVCIAPEYRLTPEAPWPTQVHDVKAAIRWVRANADRLGVDPEKIAIEGNSAGAHLALLAAGTVGVDGFEGEGGNAGVSTHVAAALGIYAPTLFSNGKRERGAVPLMALTSDRSDEVARLAGPINHVTGDFPPTLLIHGTLDTTVPASASLLMYEELLDAGVPAELHMYAGQPHAFDAQPAFGRQCAAEMALFLDRYVCSPKTYAEMAHLVAPSS